jgi:hypothetical protein
VNRRRGRLAGILAGDDFADEFRPFAGAFLLQLSLRSYWSHPLVIMRAATRLRFAASGHDSFSAYHHIFNQISISASSGSSDSESLAAPCGTNGTIPGIPLCVPILGSVCLSLFTLFETSRARALVYITERSRRPRHGHDEARTTATRDTSSVISSTALGHHRLGW